MQRWSYETEGGSDGTVEAACATSAARTAWEKLYREDSDFYKGGTIMVWREGEPRQKFEIDAEIEFHFYARKIRGLPHAD